MFAAAWPTSPDPSAPQINAMPKYVASATLGQADLDRIGWNATLLDGEVPEAIRALKQEGGGDLLVWGSAELARTLTARGLVDEYRRIVYPVVLGAGSGCSGRKRPRWTSSRSAHSRRVRRGLYTGRPPQSPPDHRACRLGSTGDSRAARPALRRLAAGRYSTASRPDRRYTRPMPPPPPARRYHHLGIPTDAPREGEVYLPHLKMYASGFETSAFGIEWIRFDADADFPDLVKTVPHVAFEVDDLDAALAGHRVLIAPNSPSPGVRVAFIEENGAPVEFIEIDRALAPDL